MASLIPGNGVYYVKVNDIPHLGEIVNRECFFGEIGAKTFILINYIFDPQMSPEILPHLAVETSHWGKVIKESYCVGISP